MRYIPTGGRCDFSKTDSRRHLDHSRSAGVTTVKPRGAAQQSELAAVHRAAAAGHREIGVVQQIEEIGSILDLQALPNWECLGDRQVHAYQTRSIICVPRRGADSPLRRASGADLIDSR